MTHTNNPHQRDIRRHVIGVLVGLLVSAAILAFLYFRKNISLEGVAQEWHKADKRILSLTILGSLLFHVFVGADKLWRVLVCMGVQIPYRELLWVRLGAGPLRMLVPLKAGDILNVLYFWRRKGMEFGRAGGAVLFDRGLNALGAVFWFLFGLLLLPRLPVYWQVLVLAGVGAAYLVFVFCRPMQALSMRIARRVSPKLEKVARGIIGPFADFSVPRKLFFLLYGLVFQLRPLAVCCLLFRAYGAAPSLTQIFAYGSVAVLTVHIPGPPVGLGAREAAIVTLFAGLASDSTLLSVGLLMTLTVHIIPMLLGIPWVPWFLRRLVSAPRGGGAEDK
ncbi:MAG: flippase-like domain-containing protein [Kiritimatiellae bacterium]|nr:flippase-like domain-containing protein [Kiritimatiellia bacterium]